MKKLFLLLLLYFLLGCASHKEKRQILQHSLNRKSALRTEVKDYLYTQKQMDSSHNFWQFYTQEPFIYHPDSGLRGQAGFLNVKNYTLHHSITVENEYEEHLEEKDNLISNQIKTKENIKQKPTAKMILYIGIGVVIAMGTFLITRVRLFFIRSKTK